MPTSEKQIEANRRNAQKSTGPKSRLGREKASRNAVKHGLYAQNIVIRSPHLRENPAEYQQFAADIETDLQPEGAIETELVRKITNCLWRLRRVIIAETAQVNRQMEEVVRYIKWESSVSEFDGNPKKAKDRKRFERIYKQAARNVAGIRCIPRECIDTVLLRYEMRLDRQLTRAYRLLSRIQHNRKANSGEGLAETCQNSGRQESGTPALRELPAGSPQSSHSCESRNPEKMDPRLRGDDLKKGGDLADRTSVGVVAGESSDSPATDPPSLKTRRAQQEEADGTDGPFILPADIGPCTIFIDPPDQAK